MKYTYDPLADAINITFKDGKITESHELTNGVILDMDKKGTPLYLEILDASKRFKQKSSSLNSLKKVSFKSLKYSKKDIRELVATK